MHTVQYASSRREVWRWYWRAWAKPTGLWLLQVAIGIILAALFTGVGLGQPFDASSFVKAFLVCVALCLVLLPLWPQIRFKPNMRSLTIDATGLKTTIGKRSGSWAWREVSAVTDSNEAIVILGKNRNAYIIPRRAFQDDAARQEFLRDATHWHQQSAA
jgi:hypothetical protein